MTTTTHTTDRWLVGAAWAGIIGPILFTVTWFAQEIFLTDGYSPLKQPVSALAAWPHGWVQNLNFVVLGLLTLGFAAGLHRGLAPSRFAIAGPVLFAVTGVGALWAAVFPIRMDAAGVPYDPGLHLVGGLMFFPVSALALVVISFRVARDRDWAPLAIPVRVAGILIIATIPAMIIFVGPEDAPLHDWFGLFQRVLVVLIFTARIALSYRLLRTAGDSQLRGAVRPRYLSGA